MSERCSLLPATTLRPPVAWLLHAAWPVGLPLARELLSSDRNRVSEHVLRMLRWDLWVPPKKAVIT